ncbi:MAG: 2,3-bisphosphoglycerate-independent phosphoglycerate mutase [Deltaproteobacteria bacterium]|nr:2,3-bisphosphoglycerate-independent phosphoglycerate mutase [Deltaproteobacteria bacterium]MBW2396210.1 2,3-bisphosphoglycerate-independent phosphoglycerate mutase [Deltaproteobacteria bacterium]
MGTSEFELKPHPTFPGVAGPVVVCVMDGVGIGRQDASDAVHLARTPHLDGLAASAPGLPLAAHGVAVGMPSDDDMGNSEVGHNAIGAGRVFDQGAKLVQQAIHSGSLFEGETGRVWQGLTERVRQANGTLHFLGLLSDGNVHSHIHHLFALLRRADQEEVRQVRLHVLLDGRDVPKTSALDYVDALEELLETLNRKADRDYRIASGGGRMLVTMDRYEADWSMVERGWKTHVKADARTFPDTRTAVQTFRHESPGINDQNLPAFVIADHGEPLGPVRDGDALVLFNFRGDRAIEISRAFDDASLSAFDRGSRPDVAYAGMMEYDGDLHVPGQYLVSPPTIERTLGEYLARNGHMQLAISETQKYGHVTYFWNGNKSGQFDESLETYVEIPSDNLPFEERPWMKAAEITDRLISELRTGRYRHARLNYANGDMVGHTGAYEASIQAVAAVDLQIGRLMPVIAELGGALIVTADHGNADLMFELDKKTGEIKRDEDGQPQAKTSHTLNPVPCWIYAPDHELAMRSVPGAGLANLAATVLHLMGFDAPEDYHRSLLR